MWRYFESEAVLNSLSGPAPHGPLPNYARPLPWLQSCLEARGDGASGVRNPYTTHGRPWAGLTVPA